MLGVQAPKVTAPLAPSPPSAPSVSSAQGPEDTWNDARTRVEERSVDVPFPSPGPPPVVVAVTPATPAARPVAAPVASGDVAALTAADVRLIVRTVVDDALLPLQRAVVESQQRIAELERRPVSATSTVRVDAIRTPAAAAPAPYASAIAAPAPYSSAAAPYASAIAAPARTFAAPPAAAPLAPLLDVQAIERDIPIDFDNPFDGRRRRRRMGALFIVALLTIFGGLFALLAESYTPHH
jgi:hypothetical protein